MIKLHHGLLFEVKIPNEETAAAVEDARLERNLEEWDSVGDFLENFQGQNGDTFGVVQKDIKAWPSATF